VEHQQAYKEQRCEMLLRGGLRREGRQRKQEYNACDEARYNTNAMRLQASRMAEPEVPLQQTINAAKREEKINKRYYFPFGLTKLSGLGNLRNARKYRRPAR